MHWALSFDMSLGSSTTTFRGTRGDDDGRGADVDEPCLGLTRAREYLSGAFHIRSFVVAIANSAGQRRGGVHDDARAAHPCGERPLIVEVASDRLGAQG